jgi:tryptophan synthase alpha chain
LTSSGADRIAEAFAAAHANGRRAALMPYLMGGFPDLDTSRAIGMAYAEGGADLIELGVPFSDPLADGSVIHAAGTAALRAGTRLEDVLGLARSLAERVPVVLMGYANPIFTRGLERFVDVLVGAGVSELLAACDQRGLALVPLVAPTTPDERLAQIGAQARGFLYTVSVTGTTGERGSLDGGSLSEVVARATASTKVPVAVGFGIATGEQARAAVEAGAEGVIVGSRLVRAAGEKSEPVAAVSAVIRELAGALG